MEREGVQGLALAVIEDGRVAHVAAYGWRNVERELPLTTETVMYGASLTKTAFAYMVLQLVDEGRLSPRRLGGRPAAAPAPRVRGLRRPGGRRALAGPHAADPADPHLGLRQLPLARAGPDAALPPRAGHAATATRARASTSCRPILEEGLGWTSGKEMQVRVFDRFGMTRTSMSWRPDFAANLADGYALDGTMEPHDERSGASAAGSMDTTIADQARLWAGIVRGDGLSRGVARRAGAAAGADHLGAPVPDAGDRDGAAERRRSASRPGWGW